ncbi:serine protease [Bacteriovoracaceae bacterium]|nr:serine protease [Bacteriovoracaceae bacterium]
MKLFILSLLSLSFATAYSLPTAPFNALEYDVSAMKTFNANEKFNYDFEGIVKLSNCSGAVIIFSGQPKTSNAYVLTNGHCLGGGFLKPNEARKNVKSNRKMKVADKDMKFFNITAQSLMYATMTGTDAALYELKETYEDLEKMGIRAFEMMPSRSTVGTKMDVVSGYWERGYRCSIDNFIFKLKEAKWSWNDSIRYSKPGCETIGGTSGSPIIETGTRKVIGVNNTSNERGRKCTLNNPCEVDSAGKVTVMKKYSYGQQVHQFYGCLTADFKIDTAVKGCVLTK